LTRSCRDGQEGGHESAICDIKRFSQALAMSFEQECKVRRRTMSSWRVKLEPIITPLFRTWWRFSRSMTVGARTICCDADGRVLLVRHSYSKGWHLPGGGVETGETVSQAATRELAEEGGVESLEAPRLIGLYFNPAPFWNDHVAIYRVENWRACAPRTGPEIAERGFFARNALPKDISPGTRRRLAEVFEGAPVSERW
jgi:ADP-ribose pyrophosphatase YjhB (NUDIX family)